MPGISTMAPRSFDDVRQSPNHLFDLAFFGGSTERKTNTFTCLIRRHPEPEQHRGRLNASARAGRTGRDADPREVERHHDRLAERAGERGVDRAADARLVVAVDAS